MPAGPRPHAARPPSGGVTPLAAARAPPRRRHTAPSRGGARPARPAPRPPPAAAATLPAQGAPQLRGHGTAPRRYVSATRAVNGGPRDRRQREEGGGRQARNAQSRWPLAANRNAPSLPPPPNQRPAAAGSIVRALRGAAPLAGAATSRSAWPAHPALAVRASRLDGLRDGQGRAPMGGKSSWARIPGSQSARAPPVPGRREPGAGSGEGRCHVGRSGRARDGGTVRGARRRRWRRRCCCAPPCCARRWAARARR